MDELKETEHIGRDLLRSILEFLRRLSTRNRKPKRGAKKKVEIDLDFTEDKNK